MSILIKNIKKLVQVEQKPQLKVCGKDMAKVGVIENAFLFIKDNKIEEFEIEAKKVNSKVIIISTEGNLNRKIYLIISITFLE